MRQLIVLLAILLMNGELWATALDDDLGGFDETAQVTADLSAYGEPLPEWLRLGGSASLWANYAYAHDTEYSFKTEHRGLAMLKPAVNLEADFDLPADWEARLTTSAFWDSVYRIRGHSEYPETVVAEYEYEAEIKEAWIAGGLGDNLDFSCGRQIEVWGKSDNIRVTDVINPLDQRNPAQLDIEDLRLPLLMSKAEYYLGSWSVSGIVVHEQAFDRNPVHGSDYFPSYTALPYEDKPAATLENSEYGLALNGIFPGYDVAFYAGRFNDNAAHVEAVLPGVNVRRHSRISMGGFAVNHVWGNWLFKSESAYLSGLEYYILPGSAFRRADLLLGVEYAGFSDTSISLEIADRRLLDYDWRLAYTPEKVKEDEFITALRLTRDFRHDSLHLTILMMLYGSQGHGGAVKRADLCYDIMDGLKITGGIVDYTSGDTLALAHAGDNDRLFVNLKYSF